MSISHGVFFAWLFLICNLAVAQPGKPQTGPAPVISGKVVKKSIGEIQSFVGTVQALQQVIVGSAVEGRVGELLVNRGDRVRGKKTMSPATGSPPDLIELGQVLAQLETKTLELQIDTARTMQQLAEDAAAEQAQNIPREIDAAKSRLAETRSREQLSRNDLERMQRLSERGGVVSATEIEIARSQHEVNQELARQAEVDLVKLNATQELKLRQTQLRIQAARQEITRLEDVKSKYTIRAPFDGFVISKLTDVGAWVRPGDPIAEIVHLDLLEFVFNVPQDFVAQVQSSLEPGGPQLTCQIQIEGLDQPINGIVDAIIPSGDLRSRTFPVRAHIQNVEKAGQPLLKPGMIGHALLELGPKREVLLVRKDALVLGPAGSVVYKLVNAGDKTVVHPVAVQQGSSLGSWIEVRGELQDQDQVVVEGNERLRPDQSVKVTSQDSSSPPALTE